VASAAVDRPFGLLAELTYGCPLYCPYCSNPLELAAYRDELATQEWLRVLAEARDLGVLQLHLSGGEPLLRRDLAEIVRSASELGLYTNLITSALGLSSRRAEQLRAAGLDHVQISVQADEATLSDRLAGTPSFGRKPRNWRPTGSSWPTRSTTAGPCSTGTGSSRAGPSSSTRRWLCVPRANASRGGWTSSTSFPTTTAGTPNPAWVAGDDGS
jgi:hypothetical protein